MYQYFIVSFSIGVFAVAVLVESPIIRLLCGYIQKVAWEQGALWLGPAQYLSWILLIIYLVLILRSSILIVRQYEYQSHLCICEIERSTRYVVLMFSIILNTE